MLNTFKDFKTKGGLESRMKYERQRVDGSVFSDMLPQKASFYMLPELPMAKCIVNKNDVSFTDLSVLNKKAVEVFYNCLSNIANNNGKPYAVVELSDIDNDTINMIIDIMESIEFSVKLNKDYKISYSVEGHRLINGTEYTINDDGTCMMLFNFNKDDAKIICNFINEKACEVEQLNLFELAVAIAERDYKLFLDYCTKNIRRKKNKK